MNWLGKLKGNFFSATNENTLALSNIKFDFSLVKVEAPMEFAGLGKALTKRRRAEAEDGLHHKTARKLAALFEQLVPSTPQLIKAYGTRSSEIIKKGNINPVGSPKDGPFEAYVGVDGTAMWAAATSGIPALGVYLLACLLARAWGAKEAISIWVELVECRRKEIQHGLEDHQPVSESSQFSLFQDIQRSELALWDSSARAWLQSADQAKFREETQLMLIVKNVQLPFEGGASTYSRVIDAWKHAMTGLEDLFCGRPQNISSRSILLAFSAWHLYLDLIILGSEVSNVRFGDHCTHPRGIGTIALQPRSEAAAQGTSWSLALSHLRYYGDPITVKSRTDFSRVDINQLHIVALGSLFGHWEISRHDLPTAAQWFVDLWKLLDVGHASDDATHTEGLDWLQCLVQAAKQTTSGRATEKQEALQLLGYGQRRAKGFLGISETYLVPFFGLSYDYVLVSLSQEDDEKRGIVFLRGIAEENGLRPGDAFISCDPKPLEHHPDVFVRQYSTAVPHSCATRKRDNHGNSLREDVHVEWRYIVSAIPPKDSRAIRVWVQEWEGRSKYGERRFEIHDLIHQTGFRGLLWRNAPELFKEANGSRCGMHSDVSCRGRPVTLSDDRPSDYYFQESVKVGQLRLFVKSAIEFHRPQQVWPIASSSENLRKAQIKPKILVAYLRYLIYSGIEERANLCPKPGPERSQPVQQSTGRVRETYRDPAANVDASFDPVQYYTTQHQEMLDPAYLSSCKKPDYVGELAKYFGSSKQRTDSLRALALATQVYRQLEGASISLKVVNSPLGESAWFDSNAREMYLSLESVVEGPFPVITPFQVPRPQAFSCIAHLESGNLQLPPDDFNETLAIASGNSIFVIGEVVSDPLDSTDGVHMK